MFFEDVFHSPYFCDTADLWRGLYKMFVFSGTASYEGTVQFMIVTYFPSIDEGSI